MVTHAALRKFEVPITAARPGSVGKQMTRNEPTQGGGAAASRWGRPGMSLNKSHADGETRVGRFYKEMIHGRAKWRWFLQTVPAPPPNHGADEGV